MANPIVTIEMESGAVRSGELYPESAPNTGNNFIALANSGFYDGVVIQRVIPGIMIQGGEPDSNDPGRPGYEIKGEELKFYDDKKLLAEFRAVQDAAAQKK